MDNLNYAAVQEHFIRMTGISADRFEYMPLLIKAAEVVVSRLKVSTENMSNVQICACEYAAAAVAVCEYAFEECVRQRPVMSENGVVSTQRADSDLLKVAYSLRENAFRQLAVLGLCDSDDFVFMCV